MIPAGVKSKWRRIIASSARFGIFAEPKVSTMIETGSATPIAYATRTCARCANPAATTFFAPWRRSEEHTSELQSQSKLVCRLLLEKKNRTWQWPQRPGLEENLSSVFLRLLSDLKF